MKIVGVCPECCLDEAVFCPRDVDGKCAHCARVLCAAHMIAHWKSVHCIALDLAHCRRHVDGQDEARAALAPSRK